MTKQTYLRTSEITPNNNISVPIGNIILTEAFFDHFGLYEEIRGLKTKGLDLGKLAELLVAYKLGDNFSVLRCHEFSMQGPVLRHMELPEFDVKTLYRAVEILGENREYIIGRFRKNFLKMYGPELTDTIFDWTSLVYFGSRPDLAARGYSRDGHPEECQVTVGISQLAKPFGVPIGMTVMPGNTHDGKHMLQTYEQVRRDLSEGSTMIFDAGAGQKDVLDMIVGDGKHFLTRKDLNKSDDNIFAGFSKDTWECLDGEKGEYCMKRKFPSRVNYYFFSQELRDLELKGVEKKIAKKLGEAKALQSDIEKGKKLKKKYQINNVLIKADIYLQTKLTEMTDDEALEILREDAVTGREGFFCLVSDIDMGAGEARSLYRDKDVIEKLFSSMKSDIGIRPIRAWTENGVYGVLLIGFLAQAVISVTRFFSKPASSTATKFIADSMQKLTLTVEKGTDGRERCILSNFNPLNIAIMRSYGVMSEA
jgi:transposase